MKTIMTAILLGGLAIARPGISQEKEEAKSQMEFCTRVDAMSKHMFRGLTFSEKPILQPTVSGTYKNLTVIGFGSYKTDTKEINEADIIADYTMLVSENVSVSAGYAYLTFPDINAKSQEVYVAVSLDTLLSPSMSIVYDFKEGDGVYGEISADHDFEKFPLSISAKLGYNHHYFRENSGFSHAELNVKIPINFGNLSVTPAISFSKSLDKRNIQDELYAGVIMEYSF